MCDTFSVGYNHSTFTLTARKPSRVLITIPHDGGRDLDFGKYIPVRTQGNRTHAMGLWPIARDIAETAGVNVVRGLLSRRLIDYDQPSGDLSFEAPQLASAHADYHGAVFEQVRQMVQRFGAEEVFVLNLHALARQPAYAGRADGYDVIVNSGNRTTVRSGAEVDRQLAAYLQARGYNVLNADTSREYKLYDRLTPSFTTAQIAREFRVNALTLEISRRFRTRDAALLGTRLANDIASFLQ